MANISRWVGQSYLRSLLVVVQEAEDVVFLEFGSAFEEVELDGEAQADNLSAELADELHGGLHGAAGGEQVVDDENALAGLDGVEVDLEGVGAVFQVVVHASSLRGQL